MQMTDHLDDENANVRRPLANYHPDLWGDQFLDYTPPDKVTQNQKEEEVKELKELVRKELVAVIKDPKERLEYVDAILRLGVAYHFEKDIDDNLQFFYNNNNLHFDDCYKDDLHYVSLRFRLLRQHGLYILCDVFENFKCNNGDFKDYLTSDVQGILSLYEASYLRVHGENILEEALAFATTCLTSFVATQLGSPMAEEIAHSLELPLQKRAIRLESRYQIAFYESKPYHDKSLLKLAKLDFNLLQVLHKMELRDYTRWSRNLDSIIKMPKFMRDRVVAGYYWSLGAYHEPKYSSARIYGGKMFKIVSIIDDIYDAYGTVEELEPFTKAIQRWDKSCINQLPEYMRLFYQATLDTFEEIEQDLTNKGRSYAVHYVRQQLATTCQGYLQEAKWRERKMVPTYEDYFNNGLLSSGYLYIIAIYVLGLEEIATKDAFEWLNHNSKTPRAACVITRLLNDIAGHKFEQQRDHVVSSVECYMAQYGTSEKEAYMEIQYRIEEVWKDINEELVGTTHTHEISKPLLTRVINLTRILYEFLKVGEDGYTIPKYSQPNIASVLVDPIII